MYDSILVDTSDAPRCLGTLWERSSSSPLGSVVFSLRGNDDTELCRATLYGAYTPPCATYYNTSAPSACKYFYIIHTRIAEKLSGCLRVLAASLGLPSEALEIAHAHLMHDSPRTFELLDIETPEVYRQQGHATTLFKSTLRWLTQNFPDSPALFAKDTSGISTLYTSWGFQNLDPEYSHVFVRDAHATWGVAIGEQVAMDRLARSSRGG